MIILYIIGYLMAWPIQLIFFKKRIYYEDKKDTNRFVKDGALIISNHRSLFDFMMSIFIFHLHKLYCIMGELIYSHGIFVSTLTTIMGGIKIDRNNHEFSFINKSVKLLNKKKLLMIYPEGKTNQKKQLNKFHTSYLLIALKSKKPIIPIYTDGSYGINKRTRVVIGKKIYLNDYCNKENPTKADLEYLNQIVVNKINELANICKINKNKDKYPQGFHIKYLFKDLGRLIAFSMNLMLRVKIFNKGKKKENLKIKSGGIILANHYSFTDPLVCLNTYWRRRIYIITAEIVFDGHKIRSKLLKSLGCIRIDRNINDIDAYNLCLDILKAGNIIVIFGAGHIEHDNNQAYKSGAALLAHKANVPIYTAYLPKKKKKLQRCHIYLGEKYEINNDKYLKSEDYNNISNELHQKILKLEEEYNGKMER